MALRRLVRDVKRGARIFIEHMGISECGSDVPVLQRVLDQGEIFARAEQPGG
jgi:hypothetical protein